MELEKFVDEVNGFEFRNGFLFTIKLQVSVHEKIPKKISDILLKKLEEFKVIWANVRDYNQGKDFESCKEEFTNAEGQIEYWDRAIKDVKNRTIK